jgi:hypothetical protein
MNCSEPFHLFCEKGPEASAEINCVECVHSKSSHMQGKNENCRPSEKSVVYMVVPESGTWSLATTGCSGETCRLMTKLSAMCAPS